MDYIDVVEKFMEKYPDIHVNYTTYEDNESLYTRLKNGGVSYDVIIPSDYMIARMIREDMLLPLDLRTSPTTSWWTSSSKTSPMTRRTSTPCPTPGAPWA